MKNILFSFLIFIVAAPALSESMYIDDSLFVPLRSGAGTSFRIIHKGIKSGTKLEIIEHDKSSGYSQVRTPSGLEGYLPSRYLTSEPIARIKLAKAEQTLARLKVENAQLNESHKKLSAQHQQLDAQHRSTISSLEKSDKELTNIKSISANALNLDRRNRELRESNEQLRNELELIRTENMRLKDKSESNMMLIGGGLVLLGVILALILPMIKPSKKNESWA